MHPPRHPRAFTLLEMTIVMLILLTLIGISLGASKKIQEWRKGRDAAESLRLVYSAQRMFLSDNPTIPAANITAAQLIPYLPNRALQLPTVTGLSGEALTINVAVSPPVLNFNGVVYDKSSTSRDNLWDVGE